MVIARDAQGVEVGRAVGATVWGGVEIREVETFLVLAEELHFGRTAARMRVSVARVSQTVRLLERRVGGALFERTSRRVWLTGLGESLLVELRPAFAELDRSLAAAAGRARGLAERLRIGHIVTVENVPRLGELIAEFERRCPSTRVRRLRFDLLDYVGSLHRDEVDVWFTWWPTPAPDGDPAAGLRCGPPISTRGRSLLVGRDHPLAGRTWIGLADLVEHPVMAMPKQGPALFRERWIPPTAPNGAPIAVVDMEWPGHFHELPPILERGEVGWLTIEGFLDTVSMPRTVVAVPVRDAPRFGLVPWWLADRETPTIRAFLEVAEDLERMPAGR